MFQQNKSVVFNKTDYVDLNPDRPHRVDLDAVLYSLVDVASFMSAAHYMQIKYVKVYTKVLKDEGQPPPSNIYGITFTDQEPSNNEAMKSQKLKIFRKANEDINFTYETFAKKADNQKEEKVFMPKDLFITCWSKPTRIILHLEFTCIFTGY